MSVTQRLIAERYRLVRPLGEGGMGRVWLARDEVLHRDVAIKEIVPPPGLTTNEREDMRRRTLREARTAARLNHPNVVRVYDVVTAEDHPWLVMEYVPSRSLHEIINMDGPLPSDRVAVIGLGVLGALRAAHAAGVLHRDVKPGNVLLTEDGRVVLTDFGLAMMVGDPSLTRSGLIIGSPAYMAPERARDGRAGPESDLWSLAATLYAALEGQSPYARTTAIGTLTALATEDPPPALHAGAVGPVLDGLLRRDPAERIDAAEAERLLRRAAGGVRGSRLRVIPGPRSAPVIAVGRARVTQADAVTPVQAATPTPTQVEPSPSDEPAVARPEPMPAPADAASTSADATPAPGDPVSSAPADAMPAPGDPVPTAAAPAPESGASAEPEADPARVPETAASLASTTTTAGPEASDPATRETAAPTSAAPAPSVAPEPVAVVAPDPVAPTVEGVSGSGRADRPVRPTRAWVVAVARVVRSHPALIAAALALLVLVVVTAVVLSGRHGRSVLPAAVPTVPAAGPSGPAATTTASPSAAATTPSQGAPPPVDLPAGWQMYHDPTGFSVAAPVGWRMSREGTILYFRDATHVLGIDQSPHPQWDPVADWTRQERARLSSGDFPRYQRIRIDRVQYWLACADWEFAYDTRGGRTHVVNRGFVTSDHQAYGIWWSTPDGQWANDFKYFDLITRTFQPKP